jgi:hypothetical protein
MDELQKGRLYTFNTINASVLGATITKARLSGIVDYSTAVLLDPNINALQTALLPYLLEGTSSKLTVYTWYVFNTQTGEMKVLAREWLNLASISEDIVSSLDIRIGGANEGDIVKIRAILGLAGYNIVNAI